VGIKAHCYPQRLFFARFYPPNILSESSAHETSQLASLASVEVGPKEALPAQTLVSVLDPEEVEPSILRYQYYPQLEGKFSSHQPQPVVAVSG